MIETKPSKGAVISECGKYRYRLWRPAYQGAEAPKRSLCFVLLNPSTADADQDDPTVRKCVGFSERMKYSQVEILNLFAWRATDPKELIAAAMAGADVVGEQWKDECQNVLSESNLIIVGWGNHAAHWALWPLTKLFMRLNSDTPYRLHCLEQNKPGRGKMFGEPKHPLYIGYDKIIGLRTWPA